ncbi:MAG: HD domain-containing protein [Bacteroidota bacterium]
MISHSHMANLESHWLPIIVPYITQLFQVTPIPSHDHLHHLRTWKHAKKLLLALTTAYSLPRKLPGQLLIACLFHDSGLTKTLGEYHGKASAEICKNFFPFPPLPKSEFHEVLEAITNHDDKSYKKRPHSPQHLYTLLTTADDLDAFGALGVVRYIEIYSMRQLNQSLLLQKAQQNLLQRLQHFELQYKDLSSVFSFYQQKANYAHQLFIRFANPNDAEAQELYNLITKEILKENQIRILSLTNSSPLITDFLQEMKTDMKISL